VNVFHIAYLASIGSVILVLVAALLGVGT